MTARRIACIWLPHFPIQRWRRRQPEQKKPSAGAPVNSEAPVVLARNGPHGPVVHDVNRVAQSLGISPGARVTDMRALAPGLRVADADLDADAADLARLAEWSRRWCPWTRVEGDSALLLDTTGANHLFGGEAAMIADMVRAFAAAGLTARVAIAPTIGAAWALAHHGPQPRMIADPETLAEKLSLLPAAALRLDADTVLLLRRLGLKTVGAVAALPREALVRRFRRIDAPGRNPVIRLDQAMGRAREPLTPGRECPPLRVLARMAEPLGDLAGLTQALTMLAGDLCHRMTRTGEGARALCFTAYRVDGTAASVQVRTGSASRDAAHLVRLFEGKFDGFDPGFGVDAAALEALRAEPLDALQDDLTGKARDDLAFARLIDRLAARLGEDAVLTPALQGSHVPERGEVFRPAAAAAPASGNPVDRGARLPLRLLTHPEEAEVIHAVPEGPPARFRWRRQLHEVARVQGPERIAPEWWREPGDTRLRDYYRVEDSEGRRFWLYREGLASDGRGGPPRWFVHGLDA